VRDQSLKLPFLLILGHKGSATEKREQPNINCAKNNIIQNVITIVKERGKEE